jgi:hypothetical protein|tara:strand:- start:231 stop:737 length:507 start_codon:yes stop_codon:yes gene_type:complete
MTRKLEEELNLPPLKEAIEEIQEEIQEDVTPSDALTVEREEIFTALKAADKIDQALPTVRGLETNDVDMDSYSNQAEQAFKDLMDLGMNVEARHAGDIFAAAQRMLKNAIEAKTSKTEKKLKMIELQLKKMKLDQTQKTDDGTIEGEGYVIADRNDILKSFIDKENDK